MVSIFETMIYSINSIKLFRSCKIYSNISIRGLKLQPNKQFIKRKNSNKNGRQLKSGDTYLQAIGTGAYDQPSTLHLYTPNRSYLFNCTENSGRYFSANLLSSSRVEHIFFTQIKWNNIGGITELLFEVLSTSGHFPTFHGPAKLFNVIREMTFLSMVGNAFKHTLTPAIINSMRSFEDECINISSVELSKNNNFMSNADVVFTYVCEIKAKPESFSLEKSIEKNVPPELLRNILDGEDITLEDGTIVKAMDVRNPSFPAKYFMVIDIPSEDFLADLRDNKRIKELLDNIGPNNLDLIVHFTPGHVFNTIQYQQIISQFNAKRHSLMNETNRYCALPYVHRIVTKLHSVDPKIHPLLAMIPDPEPVIHDTTSKIADTFDTAPKLYTKFFFHKMTDKKFIEAEEFNDEIMPFAIQETEDSKINGTTVNQRNESENMLNEVFPNVVFLGTGSSGFQYCRNSSGILVNISETDAVLLDCGEGICSQIHRFYGSQAVQIFRRIKAIYVSHTHLDHHIGLLEMFRMRKIYLPQFRIPLLLICPVYELKSWLNFYSNEIDEIESDMKMIANRTLSTETGLRRHLCKRIGIENLRTCQVPHTKSSHAVTLNIATSKEMFKLTYSGDTQPSDDLIQLAQNSSLLIHEATFQDELEVMAKQKRHSTISQAILQAEKSNAKYTILTHFSGRYHNIPYINGDLPDRIGIAFDFMRVTVDDLPRLNSLYPKYRNIFRTNIEYLEKRTSSYKRSWNTPTIKHSSCR